MENWEKLIRQSDAKMRDLPARPENWDRLARELGQLPPGSPAPGASGPGPWWLGGGAVSIVLLAVAVYFYAPLGLDKSAAEPPMAVAPSPAAPASTAADLDVAAAIGEQPQPTADLPTPSAESALSVAAADRSQPSSVTSTAISRERAVTDFAAQRSSAAPASTPATSVPNARGAADLPNGTVSRQYSATAVPSALNSELAEPAPPQQFARVNSLPIAAPVALTIPRTLPEVSSFPPPGGYRWRLQLQHVNNYVKTTPRVPFYRLDQEIPNQNSIRPERGPEELFLVGEFQAFEDEITNHNYRLMLEHRIANHWWIYSGLRHQRTVYRLDDDRTNYLGTEADLLFRGRIRYRETGVETGLGYQSKIFYGGVFDLPQSFTIRAGAYYATERTRIFDGTLQARELADPLPLRYREELLPRYRWGYQAEMTAHLYFNDLRTSVFSSFGVFTGSDGVIRLTGGLLGLSRQF